MLGESMKNESEELAQVMPELEKRIVEELLKHTPADVKKRIVEAVVRQETESVLRTMGLDRPTTKREIQNHQPALPDGL